MEGNRFRNRYGVEGAVNFLMRYNIQPNEEDSNRSFLAKIKIWNMHNDQSIREGEMEYIESNIAQIRRKMMQRHDQLALWDQATTVAKAFGFHFKRWYSGQITARQFWEVAGDKIIVVGSTVVGGGSGVAAGAAIGMMVGPVGGIIGAIIGGIIGSISGGMGGKQLSKKLRKIQRANESEKLKLQALNYFEIPADYTIEILLTAKKTKISQYYPDKWLEESPERQRKMAAKYQEGLIYFELLKNINGVEYREPQIMALK